MNSLSKKIVVCLFVLMFCINFGSTTLGAVDQCLGQSCFFCNDMPIAHEQLIHTGDSTGRVCHSSSANIPCNLEKNSGTNKQIFTVSSGKKDRQEIDGLFTFSTCKPFFIQTIRDSGKIDQLWATTDPIPIYLQNLSLLC